MFRRRSTSLILIAALLAGGAAWIANKWAISRTTLTGGPGSDGRSVVVAVLDIPYGQMVEEQHVKVIEVSPDVAPEGAFASAEEIVGRVATENAMRGDILRSGRFVSHLEGSTLASLISHNKRAITVRVDDVIGVGGFLLPGNLVDVLATRKEKKKYKTETLISYLKVLAVDQTASTNANDPVIVRAVTLEVDPAQAELIVKASNEGKIQLTLRNPQEDYVAVKKSEPQPAPKKVVRRSYQPHSVAVIRGTQVSTVRQ